MLLYNVAWSQKKFECLFAKENSILFVCAAKVRLLELQNANYERDADQPHPIRVQKVASDGLNRSLNSPVNEGSKMANRKKNRVVLKFGRFVEENVLNNILKVPAGRR